MINDNEKYGLIALHAGSSVQLKPTEIAPGLWAASEPFVMLTPLWREWLGTIRAQQIERCNVFFLVKVRSATPDILDQENLDLENQAWRAYLGLLLSKLFATAEEPLVISGARQGPEVGIRQLVNLPQPIHDALDMLHQLDASHVARAGQLAAALSAYSQASPAGGCWRFTRVVSLYAATRAIKEMVDRIHQYARCLDGLTVPPMRGGTGKNFADRVSLFVGSAHRDLFETLYKLRGEIEHLHENRYLETYDRSVRLQLLKYAGILEYVVRNCIVRVLETPSLWSHFCTTTALEAFWTLPEMKRRALWGPPVDPMEALVGFDEAWLRDGDLGGS